MDNRRAVIDAEKCDRSPWCPVKRVCPANAVEREDDNDPYFVNAYCQGCGKCVQYCPRRAVSMV
ncbi:4Fe-4S ferredoxin [Thermincola ferriacetica]|uniref:4Fe-4S ferredoxin iron-sulfur binding domain protein n=2 Tax=Thermincola TaxID=278993 RepID=D5XEH2_THEPJ|nr:MULTISPECIES: 4Fe-4S binding protein [Thermincola]ADG82043.1 4Fe-4S ferredoxin iron-sulfur binding domain protein [Thermincola potens JR]KNZ71061.1 4Fe-4S ferredoxin [Thermincola ferriacetica]